VATPATVVPAALAAAGHGEAEHQDEQDRRDDVQDSPHRPPPCPCLSSLSRRTSSTPNDSLYQHPAEDSLGSGATAQPPCACHRTLRRARGISPMIKASAQLDSSVLPTATRQVTAGNALLSNVRHSRRPRLLPIFHARLNRSGPTERGTHRGPGRHGQRVSQAPSPGYRCTTGQVRVRVTPLMAWIRDTTSRPRASMLPASARTITSYGPVSGEACGAPV